MARPLRIEYLHALYHVTVRGNAQQPIFKDDFDCDLFLDVVCTAYRRFGFIIHAFVLMKNHYHLLMETPAPNLSRVLRHINGVYTQAFNRRHKMVGHVLQGRFKAFVVEREAYYLELVRYIHLNPVRARAVPHADEFRYSGHVALIDPITAKRWQEWYHRDAVLREFGHRESDALRHYREFLDAGTGKESPLKNVIGGHVLGSKDFADRIFEKFVGQRSLRDIAKKRALTSTLSPADIITRVAKEFRMTPDDVLKSARGMIGINRARGMALYLMSRHTGMTHGAIGGAAGGIGAAIRTGTEAGGKARCGMREDSQKSPRPCAKMILYLET